MPQPNQHNQLDAQGKNGVVVQAQHFSGPLPHPAILEQYEKIVPGAAERILQKFESQSEHRQKLESSVVWVDNFKSIAGLFLGFIIAMTTIVGGIVCALKGKPLLGGTLSFAGLAILVAAFITNKITESKNK